MQIYTMYFWPSWKQQSVVFAGAFTGKQLQLMLLANV